MSGQDHLLRGHDPAAAPGAAVLKDDRERAIECARAILRGNYPPDSGPAVVAAYLLRTLGVAPF